MTSFLDRTIRRLTAQRACLNWASERIAALPGPVLEFGLGNGRSYDHLRQLFKDREVYVFDSRVEAHPACIPPAARMVLGDFRDTAPASAERFANAAALVHGDVGNSDPVASRALAAALAPHWARMLRADALLVSDQPLAHAAFVEMAALPEAAPHYRIYRRRTYLECPDRKIVSAARGPAGILEISVSSAVFDQEFGKSEADTPSRPA